MAPSPDIVVIGSGMGGATVAAGLADTGASILILERGERIEPGNGERSTRAIFVENQFRMREQWRDGNGRPFNPGNFYYVGGNSKRYGAALFRFRREDFEAREYPGGVSPAWPCPYEELEPWYRRAEALYRVRGRSGEDPTEPPRSTPYPHPPVPDEPAIADVRERLKHQDLHPFSLPSASTSTTGSRMAGPRGTDTPTPARARWTRRPAHWRKRAFGHTPCGLSFPPSRE